MTFEKESRFGVFKIDGKSVKIYSTNSSYTTIQTGITIKDVRWSGIELIVFLCDGKIRKYKTHSSYSIIQ